MEAEEHKQNTLRELTRLALTCNDLESAQRRHLQWQEQLTQIDAPISRADFQALGAVLAWKQGDLRTAWAELAQCLPTLHRTGRWPLLLTCLPASAALALAGDHPTEAAQLLGSWEGLHDRMACVPLPYERTDYTTVLTQLQSALPASDLAACREEGAQWTAQHACNTILRLVPALIQSGATRLHLA